MSKNLNKFIREMSEIYDPDSADSYVSLYFNKNSNEKFIDRRMKVCRSVLNGDALKNFIDTMTDIEYLLKKNIGKNVAIFASHKHNFLRYFSFPIKLENLLIVDSSPYLRPLARIEDEWESFTLLLVSTNYAKIFSVSVGKVEETKKLSAYIINKHKKGGQSQARFNRLRRGSIRTFLSEVIESLEKMANQHIIIAGPGQAKLQLRSMLSKSLNDNIVEIVDIDIEDEKKLLKKSINFISEREKRESREAVSLLKEEILKDGLAVYGIEDTLNAVKNGQVEMLIIEKDYKLHGWICEHCQMVGRGSKEKCSYCGKNTSEVDVIEEILEFAKRTDANIEFTDDQRIANLDHVGAILRFK
ncbi:MAG: hypothetical protein JSW62_03140 [Thermoplasmatales archaeon]|nr:MAG: hypothetical protein JSW62_03140 [Thermoplasmatales archaeon]